MPERVQLSRRKGWRKPENTVVVARPSKWGNPYRVLGKPSRGGSVIGPARPLEGGEDVLYSSHSHYLSAIEHAVDAFRRDIDLPARSSMTTERIRAELAGKNLACWCPLDQPCHADVLLEIANGDGEGTSDER